MATPKACGAPLSSRKTRPRANSQPSWPFGAPEPVFVLEVAAVLAGSGELCL